MRGHGVENVQRRSGSCSSLEQGQRETASEASSVPELVLTKKSKQLGTRGWTKRLAQAAIDDPARTVAWHDTRHIPGGVLDLDPNDRDLEAK
jgi:hypothetical protein